MALSPGMRLGPYEIVEPLGRGGMGEVYTAHDMRLDRTVAIKILPEQAAGDASLRQRFEREARTLAALSHPNICPIFDVGEAVLSSRSSPAEGEAAPGAAETTSVHYIVMEHLQGETLAARLSKGPLPIADALRYGIQIAHALDAAHRRGIIHRDLKPGNIMLTASGAKLVDFGLARLRPPVIDAGGTSSLATATGPLTARGTILGTLQYMAPEQLAGKPADERSDLFAFGAVLHEMVTGRKAFDGDSPASLVGAIMSSEPPPMSSIAALSPPALDNLVANCLAKDPDHRWQSAADVRLQVEWVVATAGQQSKIQPVGSAGASVWRWATVALAVALAGSWMLQAFRAGGSDGGRAGAAPAVTRYIVNLSGDQQLAQQMSTLTPSLALSPDGRRLVHVGMASGGETMLYMRDLDAFEAAPLPGTAGAYMPFFSPDGAWVGFFQSGELRRMSTAGGEPVTICTVSTQAPGANWLADDTIVFTPGIGAGIMRVTAAGGSPEVVTTPDRSRDELMHAFPQGLPNGKGVLFAVQTPQGFSVAVLSHETGEWQTLTPGMSPKYLPTGHVAFSRGATLWVVPFDAEALVLRGEPTPAVDRVRPIGIAGGDYAVSRTGLLAYVSATRPHPLTELRWADRLGSRTAIALESETYAYPRLSPDGTTLAFSIYTEAAGSAVWMADWRTGRRTRLNVEGNIHIYPTWSSDGRRLTFTSVRREGRLYWKRADGSGETDLLLPGATPQIAGMWSSGGALVYVEVDPATREDIWVLPPGGDPVPLVQTRARETAPAFSPDGRWLAYASDDSGRHEVYVVRYPEVDRRAVVSTGGGREPVWSQGGELFYLDERNWIVAVPMADGRPGGPAQPLFETSLIPDRFLVRTYDVSSDGQRFVLAEPTETIQLDRVHVVENWFEELIRLVPVR